jgi:hypothetical protein
LGARVHGARGVPPQFLQEDIGGGREGHAELIRPEA